METERLQEIAAATGCRVDRKNGVIRGVKIIGRVSRNGREYSARALQDAAGLYEGVKVNVGHLGHGETRKYQDRIGCLRNVHPKADGLYGDLHVNLGHSLAEQLAWDAEHAPGNVGLSHDVEGRIVRTGGKVLVEEIFSVRSVDLVADPATTGGLYEEEQVAAAFPQAAEFAKALRGADFPGGTQAAFAESIRGATVAPEALTRFVNAIQE